MPDQYSKIDLKDMGGRPGLVTKKITKTYVVHVLECEQLSHARMLYLYDRKQLFGTVS